MYWSTLLLTSTWHNAVTFNVLRYDINPLICWCLAKLAGFGHSKIIQVLPETLNGLTHADPFEASVWRWTTNTSIQALCDPWRVQMKIVQMLKIVQVFYLFWHPRQSTKSDNWWVHASGKLQLSWFRIELLELVVCIDLGACFQGEIPLLLVIYQGLEEYLWWCWRRAAGSQILVQSSMHDFIDKRVLLVINWWEWNDDEWWVILLVVQNS